MAAGFYWKGPATITWQVSGHDRQGCTYNGQATVPGHAELAVWRDLDEYGLSIWRTPDRTVDVVVDCPDREPYTTQYNHMNTNAADGEGPLPEEPFNVLVGSARYLPMNGQTGDEVSWAWSINRN